MWYTIYFISIYLFIYLLMYSLFNNELPLRLLFSWINCPTSLSPSSITTPVSHHLCGPSLDSPICPCLSCRGLQNWTYYSMCGPTHTEQMGRITSLDHMLGIILSNLWPSVQIYWPGLWHRHILGSSSTSHIASCPPVTVKILLFSWPEPKLHTCPNVPGCVQVLMAPAGSAVSPLPWGWQLVCKVSSVTEQLCP